MRPLCSIILLAFPALATVTLPIEVIGSANFSQSAMVTTGTVNADPITLKMQLHDLEFEGLYIGSSTNATMNNDADVGLGRRSHGLYSHGRPARSGELLSPGDFRSYRERQ